MFSCGSTSSDIQVQKLSNFILYELFQWRDKRKSECFQIIIGIYKTNPNNDFAHIIKFLSNNQLKINSKYVSYGKKRLKKIKKMNTKNLSLQSPILDVMTYNIRKELLKRITKYSF